MIYITHIVPGIYDYQLFLPMGDKLFMIYITHIVPGIYDYQLFLHPFGIIKMPFITASPFLEAGWVIMKHSCFSGFSIIIQIFITMQGFWYPTFSM